MIRFRWVVSLAALGIVSSAPQTAEASGFYNMPTSLQQCLGIGFGPGYHAPMLLGPMMGAKIASQPVQRLPSPPPPPRSCDGFAEPSHWAPQPAQAPGYGWAAHASPSPLTMGAVPQGYIVGPMSQPMVIAPATAPRFAAPAVPVGAEPIPAPQTLRQ